VICVFFHAIATDYDGTIATDGLTPEAVVEALRHFKSTGRRLILVTGRELDDLKAVFPGHDIFDRIVAENGAVLYEPASQRERVLALPPPPSFVEQLRDEIAPLSIGRVIVASWEPNETRILEAIKAQGLELQIIFNKGAVMVLSPWMSWDCRRSMSWAWAMQKMIMPSYRCAAVPLRSPTPCPR